MCPYAYGDGQKIKHGLHGGHGFDFFTDFFLKTVFFGFIFRFSWIRECLGTPFFWKASDNILSNTSPSYTQKEVPKHLQILLNQNQNPNITDSILSKKCIRERPIRVHRWYPCFIFWFVSLPQAGDTTAPRNKYICENNVSISLRRCPRV